MVLYRQFIFTVTFVEMHKNRKQLAFRIKELLIMTNTECDGGLAENVHASLRYQTKWNTEGQL